MNNQTNTVVQFTGGSFGEWGVTSIKTICGTEIEPVSHLHIEQTSAAALFYKAAPQKLRGEWTLTGYTSNIRYTELIEREELVRIQAELGRREATCATLIPIRKNEQWWNLAQDERRRIFEATSHHIRIGQEYLPAIARKLYHARDFGEPFDFLTWFEYAPSDTSAFMNLLERLRATEEWSFVEREVEVWLTKVS